MRRRHGVAWMELLATAVFVLGLTALMLPWVQGEANVESSAQLARHIRDDSDPVPSVQATVPTEQMHDSEATPQPRAQANTPEYAPNQSDGGGGPSQSGGGPPSQSRQRSTDGQAPPGTEAQDVAGDAHRSGSVQRTAAAPGDSPLPKTTASQADYLLALVPESEELDCASIPEGELRAAYRSAVSNLRVGLRSLTADPIHRAAEQLRWVIAASPRYAPAHLYRGVCFYALEDYRDAQFAFIEAVKLDDELWEHCPLLYYDDCGPDWPLVPTHASRKYISPIEGYVRFQPEIKPENLEVWPQSILLKDRRVLNLSVAVSFRFHGSHGHPSQPWIGLRARAHESGGRGREYLQAALRVNGEVHLRSVAHPGGAYDHRVLDAREVGISRDKWYRLQLDLLEGEYRISINGHPVLENIGTPNPALVVPGDLQFAAFAAAGNTIDVDDILITRTTSFQIPEEAP